MTIVSNAETFKVIWPKLFLFSFQGQIKSFIELILMETSVKWKGSKGQNLGKWDIKLLKWSLFLSKFSFHLHLLQIYDQSWLHELRRRSYEVVTAWFVLNKCFHCTRSSRIATGKVVNIQVAPSLPRRCSGKWMRPCWPSARPSAPTAPGPPASDRRCTATRQTRPPRCPQSSPSPERDNEVDSVMTFLAIR